MALLWNLFLTVLEVYDLILSFNRIGQHTFKIYYFLAFAHYDRCAWIPAAVICSDGDLGCCKSQCSSSGMQDTLWISEQRAYNWLRIRVLAAVGRSGPSESNFNFRYLRCWRILPKYFLFFQNIQIFPSPHFFNLKNPKGTLKIKYIFKTKYFLSIIGETAVYHWVFSLNASII